MSAIPYMAFPHPQLADADGLLAVGGDLSRDRLLLAYRFGIFPWYAEGFQILWWTPDPRCVLFPDQLKVHKSMRATLRHAPWHITADHAFEAVITACQQIDRKGQAGTWITEAMLEAYLELHRAGYAHSIEVWSDQALIGGLYGVSIGKIFFGESMFAREANASKYGFIAMVRKLAGMGFDLIDCQQDTPHLRSLGATLISREAFMQQLRVNMLREDDAGSWHDTDFNLASD